MSLLALDEAALKDSDRARSYTADVNMDVYDKRSVQFKNLTGRVYLTATSSHYLADHVGKNSNNNEGSNSWFGGSSKKELARDAMKGGYKQSITGGAIKFANEPVKSQMAIEVVRNVDVEPKYKSLYIGTSQ